jgi:hypothetical protein
VGAARRVFDFLMQNVKQDVKDVSGSPAKIVKDEQAGTAYEVDPSFASPIQCAFMFLTNLTLTEEG